MSEDCPICCCPYTAVKRRAITCMSCDESACQECIKKHLLYTVQEPHCPSCRVGWTHTFLYEELTHSFMKKTYAEHRGLILWSKEESFLPAAQQRIMDARAKGYSDNRRIIEYVMSTEGIAIDVKKSSVRKCPTNSCKGFLTQVADDSPVWNCGLCDNKTCTTCMQHCEEEHKCKKSDVDTVKLLMKDSKPCPNCGEFITKAVGCDQMWCTSCNTPFSWERMEIIKTGAIHNPHYFEFMRREGNAVLRPIENGCGQLPNYHLFSAHMRHNKIDFPTEQGFSNIIRAITHITNYLYNLYTPRYTEATLLKLRVNYLLDVYDKAGIQKNINALYIADEITRAIRPILETFVQVSTDILNEINYDTLLVLPDSVAKHEYLRDIYEKYSNIEKYINEQMEIVCDTFRCEVPYVRAYGVSTMTYNEFYNRNKKEIIYNYKTRERKQKKVEIVF